QLCKAYFGFNYDSGQLLDKTGVGDFYGQKALVPGAADIFMLLLIHHGGTERWNKFKFLSDLMAFMERYGSEIDWKKMSDAAEKHHLLHTMLNGFWLLKHVVEYPVPPEIEKRLHLHSIIAFPALRQ